MSAPGATVWTMGPVVILGQLSSKSNSRKVARFGDKTAIIKSDDARQWWADALKQVPRRPKAYEGDVTLRVTAYYKDRRRDLDIALLQDIIQDKSGKQLGLNIIKNDRQVTGIVALRLIDEKNPRTIFTVTSA